MGADARYACLPNPSHAHLRAYANLLDRRRGRRRAKAPYHLGGMTQGGDNGASKRSKVKLFTVEAAGNKGSGSFCGQQTTVPGLALFRFHLAFPTAVAMGSRTSVLDYPLERREARGC